MKTFFKRIALVLVILNFAVTGCPKDSLESWVGTYTFEEYGPEDSGIMLCYEVVIYRENNKYFADISIDGYQTMTRIKATVTGKQKKINIYFKEYLPDNLYDFYSAGDLLLSFEIKGSKLITHWEKIMPSFTEKSSSGEHFVLN